MARRPLDRFSDMPARQTSESSNKWVPWAVYAGLALIGFCFGAWAGNQKPAKPTEVAAATTPAKETGGKDTPLPVDKPEPKPVTRPTPEPAPKKDTPAAGSPISKPAELKTTEAMTPEPAAPEPKKPEPKPPEPKKPEPKPPAAKSPEPKPMVKEVSFAKEIMPIFRSKCLNCHGGTKNPKGDLDLKTVASIMKGVDNGPGVKPGDLKAGTVWKSIESGEMPPDGKNPLTPDEKKLVENWILSGAKP